MTTGQKIRYYREKLGLSQEELGTKLTVGSQAVILWETNQTLPAVEELLNMKKLFRVPVDELLNGDEPKEENAPVPREKYVVRYEKADLQTAYKASRATMFRRAALFVLACAALFIVGFGTGKFVLGLSTGLCLLGVIVYAKSFLAYGKAWKNKEAALLNTTYSYEVYRDDFVLTISRDGAVKRTQRIALSEIEKTQIVGNVVQLQISGQIYFLKQNELVPDSVFLPR